MSKRCGYPHLFFLSETISAELSGSPDNRHSIRVLLINRGKPVVIVRLQDDPQPAFS